MVVCLAAGCAIELVPQLIDCTGAPVGTISGIHVFGHADGLCIVDIQRVIDIILSEGASAVHHRAVGARRERRRGAQGTGDGPNQGIRMDQIPLPTGVRNFPKRKVAAELE